MYITPFERLCRSIYNKCPRKWRSGFMYMVKNPSASGLIIALAAASTGLNAYCMLYVFPIILEYCSMLKFVLYCGSNLLTLGILGHLYVISKDETVVITKILRIEESEEVDRNAGNPYSYSGSEMSVRPRVCRPTSHPNRRDAITTPGPTVDTKQPAPLKQLGLLLYLTVGSFLAFLTCTLGLLLTEGIHSSLRLLVQVYLFFLFPVYHGAVFTYLSGIGFAVTLVLLTLYLKTAMRARRMDAEISTSTFIDFLVNVSSKQSLIWILIPDVITAYCVKSAILPVSLNSNSC